MPIKHMYNLRRTVWAPAAMLRMLRRTKIPPLISALLCGFAGVGVSADALGGGPPLAGLQKLRLGEPGPHLQGQLGPQPGDGLPRVRSAYKTLHTLHLQSTPSSCCVLWQSACIACTPADALLGFYDSLTPPAMH